MMISADNNPAPDDPIAVQLDQEIRSLKSQITSLKAQRQLRVATILSSYAPSTLSNLQPTTSQPQNPTTTSTPHPTYPTDPSPLLPASKSQSTHNLQNLYRLCTTLTTFAIHDPDPHAVNNGQVLGVRIDVSSTAGKYLHPYYVMLNKRFLGSDALQVHRHTLPPCIHLEELAGRWLPTPPTTKAGNDGMEGKKKGGRQDLKRFLREVRREVVGYRNRTAVIKNLRKEFALDEKVSRKGKGRERVIADVAAADAEAKQVRIEWVDGRVGRVVIGENGEVAGCVVRGEEGRIWEVERRVCGDNSGGQEGRMMTGIGERLREGLY